MNTLNPEMVRLARDARGYTQAELADAAKVAQGTISKIEQGEKDITGETIHRIAEALHYPATMFFMDENYAGIGISTLYFRKRASALQKHVRRLHALVNVHRIHAKILSGNASIHPSAEMQRIDITDFLGTPAEIADMTRAAWKIPPGPIRNLVALIENAGGFIFKFAFGTTDIDAISQWPHGSPPLFFLNSQSPPERTRFSLCMNSAIS